MAIKIMITDDHSMIREGLKNLLELDGDIEVIAEAVDGEDCLDKLLTVTPDVLLLDINMPKMNGLEATEAIRKSGKEDALTIPIVAMTANVYSEDKKATQAAGMNDHLSKPVEITKMMKMLAIEM